MSRSKEIFVIYARAFAVSLFFLFIQVEWFFESSCCFPREIAWKNVWPKIVKLRRGAFEITSSPNTVPTANSGHLFHQAFAVLTAIGSFYQQLWYLLEIKLTMNRMHRELLTSQRNKISEDKQRNLIYSYNWILRMSMAGYLVEYNFELVHHYTLYCSRIGIH